MSGEIAFIELGVGNPEAGKTFYQGLFGWEFEPGPNGGGHMIRTPNVPGGMHGGDPGASPIVFFAVDDMEDAVDRVRELGGQIEEINVEGDAASVAEHGQFRMCRDDQGSPFGLHRAPGAG